MSSDHCPLPFSSPATVRLAVPRHDKSAWGELAPTNPRNWGGWGGQLAGSHCSASCRHPRPPGSTQALSHTSTMPRIQSSLFPALHGGRSKPGSRARRPDRRHTARARGAPLEAVGARAALADRAATAARLGNAVNLRLLPTSDRATCPGGCDLRRERARRRHCAIAHAFVRACMQRSRRDWCFFFFNFAQGRNWTGSGDVTACVIVRLHLLSRRVMLNVAFARLRGSVGDASSLYSLSVTRTLLCTHVVCA